MDEIDTALVVLAELIKTMISVAWDTTKMMLSIMAEVAGTTIKLMFKKHD